MRPLVHPALTRVWRDPSTIQIGLDPQRAVVLGGLAAPETAVLRSLDGSRDHSTLRALGTAAGGDAAGTDRLLEMLRTTGVVVDSDLLPHAHPAADPRAPDQACLGLLTGAPDGGAAAMAARRQRWVEVRGAGRVGAGIARLLSASGVGRTTLVDAEAVTVHDICPGGLAPEQVGQARGAAAQALVDQNITAERTRAADGASADARTRRDTAPVNKSGNPDVVVLTPPPGTLVAGNETLLRAGVPHLLARMIEVTGIVGPLVLPGRSSCLRCLDLHRTDRDPAWPRIVAQAAHRRPAVAACDLALAAHVAGLAAQQVLAHLDGFPCAAIDGTIETALPYGLPRRRSWTPHPACGCTWR